MEQPLYLANMFNFPVDVVLTTKYRTGWCNFPSQNHPTWNSVDNGPHKDITGELSASVHRKGLKMGFYHSLKEWYNPLLEKVCHHANNTHCTFCLFYSPLPSLSPSLPSLPLSLLSSYHYQDLKNNCSTTKYVQKVMIPTLKQLVEDYKVYNNNT